MIEQNKIDQLCLKVKDVWAEDIKLASNTGDVLCYGTMEGAIKAETLGDGDFVARYLVGPRLEVNTDRGDICIWDDCHSEVTQLFTNSGNIYCSRLFSDAKICIKNKVLECFLLVLNVFFLFILGKPSKKINTFQNPPTPLAQYGKK